MRNQGAMLSDPGVREGYVQGAVARGMEAAGSNRNGSMAAFMGMGVGMNAGGGFMGAASQANLQQMQMNQMAGTNQMTRSSTDGREPTDDRNPTDGRRPDRHLPGPANAELSTRENSVRSAELPAGRTVDL